MERHEREWTQPIYHGKFYSFILSARGKNGIAYILENKHQGKGKMLETEAMTTSCVDPSAVMAYVVALR